MELKADAVMPFPRPLVFATYRDKLADLVPYFHNIRAIEVRSREEDGPVTRLLNIWHGGGEIPRAARAVISEAMLSWTDHALWNQAEWYCDWRIETHAFSEAVRCGGRNHYHEVDGGTRLEIRGTLEIDGKKIKGVPGFLAGKVGKMVEEFLANRIQPNLAATAQGVRKFLEDEAGKK